MSYKKISIFGFYFLITVFFGLFINDFHWPIKLSSTPSDILLLSNYSDPKSFLAAALDISRFNGLTAESFYVFNLWPPGFVITESIIIRLLGESTLILFWILIVIAILNGMLSLKIVELNIFYLSEKKAIILPFLLFIFPAYRVFVTQSVGLAFGECFSILFFCLFIITIISCNEKENYKIILSGILLALSAYYRSQFEVIVIGLTLTGIIFWLFSLLLAKRSNDVNHFKNASKVLIKVIIVANIAMLPWRIYHFISMDTFAWTLTPTHIEMVNSVESHDSLRSKGASWLVEGGGNLTCRIDPLTCGKSENARELFISTFLNHPLEWIAIKFSLFPKYWFSSIQDLATPTTKIGFFDTLFNVIYLLGFLILVLEFIYFSLNISIFSIFFGWILSSVTISYLAIFTMAHYEARYMIFPKIFIIFMLICSIPRLIFIASKKFNSNI